MSSSWEEGEFLAPEIFLRTTATIPITIRTRTRDTKRNPTTSGIILKIQTLLDSPLSLSLSHRSGCSSSSSGMVASCFSPGLVVKASSLKGLDLTPAELE